jgi:hypothetical protein
MRGAVRIQQFAFCADWMCVHSVAAVSLLPSAGVRSGDLEEPVANNSTIYSINAVVLATAAGIAAYNPGLVRPTCCLHCLSLLPCIQP